MFFRVNTSNCDLVTNLGKLLTFSSLVQGIKRETEEEKSFGDFQLFTEDSPYSSTNLTYEPIQFDRLRQLNCYNIINNKDTITKALTMAMMRKKFKKKRK